MIGQFSHGGIDFKVGGTVALWFVRSSSDQVVQIQALARDMLLCSYSRHFTLTVTLSTQVYK